ncbi:MAG: LiaI-LiaF-like domain-containing protein [Anaerolineae bacterium]
MNNDRRHVSLVGPTLLIGLGLIMLLNNLGYLNWGFGDVLRLWPILLVAAGLELLLGRRSIWASLAAAVLVLLMIGGAIWMVGIVEPDRAGGELVEVRYPLEDTATARVRLSPAVGRLTVSALTDSANLTEAEIELHQGERLSEQFSAGRQAELTLATDDRGPFTYTGLGRTVRWDVRLNPEVELDLTTDLGVGDAEIDLSALTITDATVDFGVGQVDLVLPEIQSADVMVDGGIGTIVIETPPTLGVRIVADTGLVTRDLPTSYRREGNVFTSPGYDRADARVDLVVSLGIGTLTVRPAQ